LVPSRKPMISSMPTLSAICSLNLVVVAEKRN
jgi:hypothetical protein